MLTPANLPRLLHTNIKGVTRKRCRAQPRLRDPSKRIPRDKITWPGASPGLLYGSVTSDVWCRVVLLEGCVVCRSRFRESSERT